MVNKKLFRPGTRESLRKTEKSARLLSAIVQCFTPAKELALGSYVGYLATAIAALRSARTCTFIEKDELCFGVAVSRLAFLTDSLDFCATPSNINGSLCNFMKIFRREMDTEIGSAQTNEDEDLCGFDLCASVDASKGLIGGCVDVVDTSELDNGNVCEAVSGSEAVWQSDVNFVTENKIANPEHDGVVRTRDATKCSRMIRENCQTSVKMDRKLIAIGSKDLYPPSTPVVNELTVCLGKTAFLKQDRQVWMDTKTH